MIKTDRKWLNGREKIVPRSLNFKFFSIGIGISEFLFWLWYARAHASNTSSAIVLNKPTHLRLRRGSTEFHTFPLKRGTMPWTILRFIDKTLYTFSITKTTFAGFCWKPLFCSESPIKYYRLLTTQSFMSVICYGKANICVCVCVFLRVFLLSINKQNI